jgi:hypothetical protein
MNETTDTPELVDARIGVEPIPGTQLVHVSIGDRVGFVLTRSEVRTLRNRLRTGSRASGSARPLARTRAAAA